VAFFARHDYVAEEELYEAESLASASKESEKPCRIRDRYRR
jgi:hypothetical protein